MYTSEVTPSEPYRDGPEDEDESSPPPSIALESDAKRDGIPEGVMLPQVSHSLAEPPSHPHPLLRPRPAEMGPPADKDRFKGKDRAPVEMERRETVFVYPSQARDVGRRDEAGAGWSASEEDITSAASAAGRNGKGQRRRQRSEGEAGAYRDAKHVRAE